MVYFHSDPDSIVVTFFTVEDWKNSKIAGLSISKCSRWMIEGDGVASSCHFFEIPLLTIDRVPLNTLLSIVLHVELMLALYILMRHQC